MTKQNELEILDEAIAKLGRDSYCGAWLKSVRGEVENDIRCDCFPSASISEAEKHSRTLRASAQEFRDTMVSNAEAEARRIIADAKVNADKIFEGRHVMHKATLGRIIRALQEANSEL